MVPSHYPINERAHSSSTSPAHFKNSFANEMVDMESVKTIHSLEAELIRLRESTKDALQQAWEEVEILQQQCTAHLEIITQTETDLMETKRREEYWHKRCLESEKLLLQANNTNDPDSLRSLMSHEKNFISWPSIKLSRRKGTSIEDSSKRPFCENSLSSTSFYTSTSLQSSSRTISESEQEKSKELELKLSSRDSAIESLERTISQHVKAMHTMQAEMQCMMETQRIKEKNAQNNFVRKESLYQKEINILQDTAQKKTVSFAGQKKKINQYKLYIGELTKELERVLTIVQKAEKSGMKLNSKPSKKKKSASMTFASS